MNPERMVISEARRTYTYLGLFGYGVDSAIVNRVLPEEVEDPYFAKWRSIQEGHLESVEEGSPAWTSAGCGSSTRRWWAWNAFAGRHGALRREGSH